MTADRWAPDDVSQDRPSVARMYDYFLGGYHNFAIDRMAAERVVQISPDAPLIMQANRAFLRRAVNYLLEQGIDQFLDFGSGIPTVGNVHEVAQATNPAARTVYVVLDPVAVRHGEAILEGNANVSIIQADARDARHILEHPEVRWQLDFDRPVGVLLVSILLFIPDDDEVHRSIRRLCDALAPGSYLVISHGTYEDVSPELVAQVQTLYSRTTTLVKSRSRAEIQEFFRGLELVDPGLVHVPLWRPEGPEDLFVDTPGRSVNFAAVGRKP